MLGVGGVFVWRGRMPTRSPRAVRVVRVVRVVRSGG